MPDQRPLQQGDVPYPQYSVTDKEFIKKDLAIIKGHIYTLDDAGRMIVPISAAAVADVTKGIVQAKADAPAPSEEDVDEVQVLKPRSRVILRARAGLVPTEEVEMASAGTTTTADKVQKSLSPRSKGYLGRIFEIYTQGTDGIKKQVTVDNDLVVVDLEA